MNYLPTLQNISPVILFLLLLWTLVWKGIALWKAAKHSQRNWFIVILVINTIGILEIVYLFGFCKQKLTLSDLKIWEKLQF